MKNFKIIKNIIIGAFAIFLLLPSFIINMFDWYMAFDDGNLLYYIIMSYIFVPIILSLHKDDINKMYVSIANVFILFLAIEFINEPSLYNGDMWFLIIFVLVYFMLLVWALGLSDKIVNFDKYGLSSFVNPKHLSQGYLWSYVKDITTKLAFNEEKKNLYIDNFRLDRDIPNKEIIEQTQTFINPLDTTKTILALGKMGSGKTEFFNSILAQNDTFDLYNREIIHDVKGDFTQKFYDKDTDFIFNPYDSRGCYFDIWQDMKESESLVISFITNLIESNLKEKDFFSSSASSELSQFFVKTHFMHKDKSSCEKWIILLNEIEKYKDECGDDRTKTSIYANMELGIEMFKLFAWQSAQSNIKVFTLKDFLNSKGRLILLNNATHSKKLYPLFTGFVAMLIEIMLSKEDTKEDLSLLLLDEYLSIKFDDEIRLKLQTQIRSKGGCLLIGIQYIDMQNMKSKQLLDSSKFATLVFNVSDNETIKHLCSAYGTVHYEKHKESKQKSVSKDGSSSSRTQSIEEKQENFLTPKHIQSMPEFHHLTLIPEKEIFYLGYTPLVELETINKAFEKRDLTSYYEFIYKQSSKKEMKVIEHTFSEKRDIYNEIMALDAQADNYNEELLNILNKYNLNDIEFDEYFNEVME